MRVIVGDIALNWVIVEAIRSGIVDPAGLVRRPAAGRATRAGHGEGDC